MTKQQYEEARIIARKSNDIKHIQDVLEGMSGMAFDKTINGKVKSARLPDHIFEKVKEFIQTELQNEMEILKTKFQEI